ncbi:MAG: hypothetical protein A2Z19_01460 [Deltaproteobacteria bacterium RBG_16_54_18]|nr:MAG: hypothetical protein A2Z19_01460 [Deltaproteobacteria bacterium RBG_16_54_18]
MLEHLDLKGKNNRLAICVDRDGVWYFEGREIIRKDILSLFYDSLHLDADGYYLEINEERECLEVEDTVFLVHGAELIKEKEEEAFIISLNDGTQEQLNLDTLRITKENVPYCLVKGGMFPARFLRLPFYQVAQHALHDEERDEYFLLLNGRRIVLQAGS